MFRIEASLKNEEIVVPKSVTSTFKLQVSYSIYIHIVYSYTYMKRILCKCGVLSRLVKLTLAVRETGVSRQNEGPIKDTPLNPSIQ